jgi:signal transduction histidine kinase
MKIFHSAKRLTFLYFSIVAAAIIIIHASVFEFTTEDLEHIYAENKLLNLSSYSSKIFKEKNITNIAKVDVHTQGNTDFDPSPVVYFDFTKLPSFFPDPEQLSYDEAIEVSTSSDFETYFVMKKKLQINGESIDALLSLDNSLYEISEEQLFDTLTKQFLTSLILLIVSLSVVLTIADKLTKPISTFAKALAKKSSTDLSPISPPKGTQTSELMGMVETFNAYQQRIQNLVERERSFNRYASHELRTPLTVITGAVTLLGESNDKAFIDKQHKRLLKASLEMNEFIETLLNLTKPVDELELEVKNVTTKQLNALIEDHLHLIKDKNIIWQLDLIAEPEVMMPTTAFNMLLGNLIKNAFAYTLDGKVIIEADQHHLKIIDTGTGLKQNSNNQGYGLGLLLVRDICQQYDCVFAIANNEYDGCTATLHLPSLKESNHND